MVIIQGFLGSGRDRGREGEEGERWGRREEGVLLLEGEPCSQELLVRDKELYLYNLTQTSILSSFE